MGGEYQCSASETDASMRLVELLVKASSVCSENGGVDDASVRGGDPGAAVDGVVQSGILDSLAGKRRRKLRLARALGHALRQ